MSTLTKVFIVVLCVFSIAFTTMTVSIVAKWADWKELANDYQQHAVVADTNLRHMIAANAAELATANDTIKGHLEQIGEIGKLSDHSHRRTGIHKHRVFESLLMRQRRLTITFEHPKLNVMDVERVHKRCWISDLPDFYVA